MSAYANATRCTERGCGQFTTSTRGLCMLHRKLARLAQKAPVKRVALRMDDRERRLLEAASARRAT